MRRFLLLIAASLFAVGCNSSSSNEGTWAALSDATTVPMTDEEEAANTLYLSDTVDSAGNDKGQSSEEKGDPSAKEDCKARRVEQMANMMMDKLDADDSGSLSLEEFLGIISKMKLPSDAAKSAEISEKAKVKMTEEFKKFAGTDGSLAIEELQELLKAQGPRVGRFRAHMFPEGQEERLKKLVDELIAKFDNDGDGKLSAEELQEAMATRQEQCGSWNKKKSSRSIPVGNKGPQDDGVPGSGDNGQLPAFRR